MTCACGHHALAHRDRLPGIVAATFCALCMCPGFCAPGAQPQTEMDDVDTAEQCERCGGYADNCPCPKGNA